MAYLAPATVQGLSQRSLTELRRVNRIAREESENLDQIIDKVMVDKKTSKYKQDICQRLLKTRRSLATRVNGTYSIVLELECATEGIANPADILGPLPDVIIPKDHRDFANKIYEILCNLQFDTAKNLIELIPARPTFEKADKAHVIKPIRSKYALPEPISDNNNTKNWLSQRLGGVGHLRSISKG